MACWHQRIDRLTAYRAAQLKRLKAFNEACATRSANIGRFRSFAENENSRAPLFAPRRHKLVKAVILAGGLGTRISEETQVRPKPMIEIGGRPVLWHIMKSYAQYGITDFIICCGYRGYT